MKFVELIFIVSLQIYGLNSLIVPDEVPTILSVIFSNIPTIKKGTDSRLGWGFRLGDRADFQVLVELGPQTYTQPLANQEDKGNNNKRNSLNTLANTLYAERQHEKKIKQQEKEIQREKKFREQQKETNAEPVNNNEGVKWLQEWSKNAEERQENEPLPLKPRPGIAVGEIDAKSVIPEDSVLEKQESSPAARLKAEKISPLQEKPLDDVSLE